MNKLHIVIWLLISFSAVIAQPPQSGNRIVILHTNDLHSRLDGFSPSLNYTPLTINDDKTIGGFSRIASIINKEKGTGRDNTIVVDAGDFLMGTLYHYMEEHNGFQLRLMKEMGFELVALGNHEFDFGPGKLATIINKSRTLGDTPQLMLTNIECDPESSEDDDIEKLVESGVIARTFIIEKNDLKVGFFSLMGEDADDVAPFAEPVRFGKQIKYAKRAVKELLGKDADIVICLSHSGLTKLDDGTWEGEDYELAGKVDGIDLIISAHTHSILAEPLIVNGTTIVQTGSEGRNIGRVELESVDGKVRLVSYNLIPVNDALMGSADIQQKIDIQKDLISEKLLKPLGYNAESPIVESDFEAVCNEYGGDLENSNLGPLVADAIHRFINLNSETGSDISMVATGVIRDRIPVGKSSVQDIFRIMSLGSGDDPVPGYPLARIHLTGREIKNVIEILMHTSKSSPSNYCYFSGLELDFNPEKGLLKKISSIRLTDKNGEKKELDLSKKNQTLYSVSANAYMLKFIGIIKKTTLGLVNVTPKNARGEEIVDMSRSVIDFDLSKDGVQEGKEWIALVEYLNSMKDTDGDGIPDLDEYYRKPPLRLKPVK